MQSQTQTLSVPVIISQFSMGKTVRTKSSSTNLPTKTTTTSFRSPTVKTVYRTNSINNQKSIYMSVSSSSSTKTTTTTTTTRMNNNNNNNNINCNMYIKGKSNTKGLTDVQFLLSLFTVSFKYIFIISCNVFEKLLFVVLNPFESIIYVSCRINEIRSMNKYIDELKYERSQLINQGDQLLAQLNAVRICYRNVESSYRAMKQKRDTLKDTIKALQNELQRERESRFVVEKCHNERIEKLEFEIDMKEQEIMNYEDKERLLKKKIHKLKKKLKNNASSTSYSLTLPSFSLQNFNTFSFDDPLPSKDTDANSTTKNEVENNSEDLYYSSSEDENFVFAKESDAESSSSESSSEEETDSDSDTDNSESDSDLDDLYGGSVPREIPKNSIYYNMGRQHDSKDDEEEELEVGSNKMEAQNPLVILRQEAYNCLYQSLVSELCTSSILMDLDVKMDKNNFSSYTCISIILEAFIHYLEAKKQITNEEAIEKLFIRYRPLILNYTDSKEDQMNLLVALEYICIENSLRLQQHLRILMAIYKAELVDPSIIIQWYHLLPDFDDAAHHTCPMTPNVNCILPKIPTNKLDKSQTEGDYKSFGKMIDGHYATQSITLTKDNATIHCKGHNEGHDDVKSEAKAFTDTLLRAGEKDANDENKSTHSSKSKNNGHNSRSHAMRRKRSMSNASDSGVVLRRDVRELAKFFALWLESKETSSSDDESILDSMSQEIDDESEDSGNELRNLHRRLLSEDDSKDSPIIDGDNSSDIISVATEDEPYPLLSPKKCKKVTFNLTPIDAKDDDVTINNEEYNESYFKVPANKVSPLAACLDNNPLSRNFDFPEVEGELDEDDEEIIEEVEEVIEEEEEVVEEIIEEVVNTNGESYNPDDESVTIVEEKEEVIDEVVECIKVTC